MADILDNEEYFVLYSPTPVSLKDAIRMATGKNANVKVFRTKKLDDGSYKATWYLVKSTSRD